MSKLRTRINTKTDQPSKNRFKDLFQRMGVSKKSDRNSTLQSKIYQQTRCHTIDSDPSQTLKDQLYNKNINLFRESFRPNDTQILPFLASLRVMKDYRHNEKDKQVTLSPFEADRPTANQKIKKNVSDIKANPFRVSKAYYRWQHRSGQAVKATCQFQCNLRLDSKLADSSNPEVSTFNNTLAPIRLRTLQAPRYKASELICDRQRRLFTLQPE